MKILLLGKNGQVGWELQRSLAPLGQLQALDRRSTQACGDLTDLKGLQASVLNWRPDVVVNAAAYTAVDKAEADPEMARLVNAHAPEALAKACAQVGAWLLHYSTDYVFEGGGSQPWKEDDATGPLGVYGLTKLQGEQAIQAHCPKHLIFRTSWVCAARGANFAKTMLRLAQEREQMSVIDDQWGAPTGADLLADVTAHVLRQISGEGAERLAGIYHLVAAGQTTWHAYAQHVLRTAQEISPALAYKVKDLAAVPTSAYPTPARRPNNSRMNTQKLQNTFALHLPPWQQGVDRMLAEIL